MYKKHYLPKCILGLVLLFIAHNLSAQTLIKGLVVDSKTKETLTGVTIAIKGTTNGNITDIDGNYKLAVAPGNYTLVASYISYATQEITNIDVKKGETIILNIDMKESNTSLNEVIVTARQNMEAERALSIERKTSTIAVENLGAKEMSIKGLSTVADGIKKITGISMEGNSKVLVRGLGDRYSMTSLNGFPIASPNPDNKLIPLTLFPTSVVKNVTVSKVYQPSVFGDYSGAHIDVETKENIGADFINFGISTGGRLNTVFNDFYASDKTGVGASYLGLSQGLFMAKEIWDMKPLNFGTYYKNNNPFKTSFNISKKTAMPELGLEFGAGRSWKVGQQKLNAMVAANFNNDYTIYDDAYTSRRNAQGYLLREYNSNKYAYETTFTSLAQVSYTLRKNDMLSYNLMFVNNTEDELEHQRGMDIDVHENMRVTNSVYHIYTLLNNQITGKHQFMRDRLFVDWQGSYGQTSSDEPDRRSMPLGVTDNNKLIFIDQYSDSRPFRYYSALFENEFNADAKVKYRFNQNTNKPNFLRLGVSFRDKSRDFNSMRFIYKTDSQNKPIVDNIFDVSSAINEANIQNGMLSISKDQPSQNAYFAGNKIMASFIDMEYYLTPELLIAGGLRYENSNQWVRYWNQSAREKKASLNAQDLFPALNLKYTIEGVNTQNIRFSASRTITRPSFVEMAPFEYQESFGGDITIGSDTIRNGYNYNLDVRYEIFTKGDDMYSIGAYYKYLDDPIEQIQVLKSSYLVQSFTNIGKGNAAGIELEIRKKLTKDIRFDFNASYIFTQIDLSDKKALGLETEKKRKLQGASPYLLNLDLNYSPQFANDKSASISLIYNLQGARINSVGIIGINNKIEKEVHSLDFVATYALNKKMKLKFQAKNILNQARKFVQDVNGEDVLIDSYKKGTSVGIGFSMSL